MGRVEFQSPSGRTLEVLPIVGEPFDETDGSEPFRVRDLIAKLVSECVRDFHLREKERAFTFLTPEAIQKGLEKGKFGSSREERQKVDVDEAVGQALQAFEDRLYLLFVDKAEKRSLEDIVRLQPDTVVTVIRLTALAGA